MHYVVNAVDLSGVAQATYELECADDEEAKGRAAKFLDAHPTVELWKGLRRVARLTRNEAKNGSKPG
jgi:hypothetical protein